MSVTAWAGTSFASASASPALFPIVNWPGGTSSISMPVDLSRTRHGRPVRTIASRRAASVTTLGSQSFSMTSHQSSDVGARTASAFCTGGGGEAPAPFADPRTAGAAGGTTAGAPSRTGTTPPEAGSERLVVGGLPFMNLAYQTRSRSSIRARRRSRSTVRSFDCSSPMMTMPARSRGTTSSSIRSPIR